MPVDARRICKIILNIDDESVILIRFYRGPWVDA
jgi:hypothetical protein